MTSKVNVLRDIKQFFNDLRHNQAHLGLDPEFSALEAIFTSEGYEHYAMLRENLDRFFFGRGFSVLDRLRENAKKMDKSDILEGMDKFKEGINQLFANQFNVYDNNPQFLPQSEMIREMLKLTNDNRADDIIAFIEKNIDHMDGHFYMILSESLRNARMRNEVPTWQVLVMLGRVAAETRLKNNLPCNFASLWQM